MMLRQSAVLAAVFSLVFTFLAGNALAQNAADPGPDASPANHTDAPSSVNDIHTPVVVPIITDRVLYTIRALTPGKKFDVRTEDDDVVARCSGTCTLALPLGSYKLGLYDAAGRPERGTSFEVKGPGRLEFEGANSNVATAGAVLGSVGAVMVIVGAVLLTEGICIEECPDSAERSKNAGIGLATMLIGATATPIGWVLFAHNLRPSKHEYPFVTPYAAATSDRGGGVIGIVGAF